MPAAPPPPGPAPDFAKVGSKAYSKSRLSTLIRDREARHDMFQVRQMALCVLLDVLLVLVVTAYYSLIVLPSTRITCAHPSNAEQSEHQLGRRRESFCLCRYPAG